MCPNTTINHFDRSKLFYPLVMLYLAQLIGIKELALRGVVGSAALIDLTNSIPVISDLAGNEQELTKVQENLRKLSGPLELRSEYQDNNITIEIDQIAREILDNHAYLFTFLMRSAGSLLILAQETSKDSPWHNREPMWEFLRHARNAAGHDGRFNFLHGEPKRPASWGSFEIVEDLQGTLLFKDASGDGLLSPGDPIRLLWDLEQAYPAMTAELG